jgi:hypothetical protein
MLQWIGIYYYHRETLRCYSCSGCYACWPRAGDDDVRLELAFHTLQRDWQLRNLFRIERWRYIGEPTFSGSIHCRYVRLRRPMGWTSWAKPSPQDAAALVFALPARHCSSHLVLTGVVCRLAAQSSIQRHHSARGWCLGRLSTSPTCHCKRSKSTRKFSLGPINECLCRV